MSGGRAGVIIGSRGQEGVWRLGGRTERRMGQATHSGWATALVAVGKELVQHHSEAPHVRLAGEDVVR